MGSSFGFETKIYVSWFGKRFLVGLKLLLDFDNTISFNGTIHLR